jgi:hypothetical protein
MDSINPEPSSPTGQQLLELERSSRQQGSGIDGASICATWWLDQLWGRRQARSMGRSAALMRTLQACLEIGMEAERLVLRLLGLVLLGRLVPARMMQFRAKSSICVTTTST